MWRDTMWGPSLLLGGGDEALTGPGLGQRVRPAVGLALVFAEDFAARARKFG